MQEEADDTTWGIRNRTGGSLFVVPGHAHQGIISHNLEKFKSHPEYLGEPRDVTKGVGNAKLDPSQPAVLEMALDEVLKHFEKFPTRDSVSMEASDGGGWRKDSPLGPPSNQSVALANYVARGIQKQFPYKKVGILSYNEHSFPPTIDVDPNVVVMVHVNFNVGGMSYEKRIAGWKAKGADVGTSELIGDWLFCHDMPGQAKASDLDYLVKNIPYRHQLGSRYWNSICSSAWGPFGLNYYLVSRMLWDVNEAKHIPELVDDFMKRSFGASAPIMHEYYYNYLLTSGHPVLSEDLIKRMYQTLEKAIAQADSVEAKERITDFIVHVHMMELWLQYKTKGGGQDIYDEMSRFVYRTSQTRMLCSRVWLSEAWGTKRNKYKLWSKSTETQTTEPVQETELFEIMRHGIANNKLMPFKTVAFSSELVPWTGPNSNLDKKGSESICIVWGNQFYLHADQGKKGFDFTIKGGLTFPGRSPVKVKLFADENPNIDEPVDQLDVKDDQQSHQIHLSSPYAGIHRLEIENRGRALLSWPQGQRVNIPVSPGDKTNLIGENYTMYFYVPTGTKIIGGFSETKSGTIESPLGKTVFNFKEMEKPDYFYADVPAGQDGKWWRLVDAQGPKTLLTVPPYLFRTPSEALLPKDAF
jgi:hypothetical protein